MNTQIRNRLSILSSISRRGVSGYQRKNVCPHNCKNRVSGFNGIRSIRYPEGEIEEVDNKNPDALEEELNGYSPS